MTAAQPPAAALPAGTAARVGSYLVDLAAILGVAALTWPLARSWVVLALVVVEGFVVVSIARAATGRTPGALLTRTVGHTAGSDLAPGLGRQAVRSALLGVLHLTVLGPLVTAATSRAGRDWVDRIAGTAVADLRPRPAPVALPVGPYEPAPRARRAFIEPPPARPAALDRAWIVLDSGTRIEVDSVLLLGRDPEHARPGEQVVSVPDPGRSVSRTHVRIGVDDTGVWVEDAFSANGTTCRTPGGGTLAIARGQRTVVPPGTTVLLGDRFLTVHAETAG